jgi:hypothetical protein
VKVFISYALSLVGLGFVVATVIATTLVNLSYPAARMRIISMMQQNLNKAEIMCRTAKGTFYEALGSAIKIGAMVQTTDVALIASATKPGYDGAIVMIGMYWKKLFGRGKIGVMLVVGGLIMAIAIKTSPILHIIVVVLSGIAVGWFLYTRGEHERTLMLARAEILPVLDQAFADGRYTRYG